MEGARGENGVKGELLTHPPHQKWGEKQTWKEMHPRRSADYGTTYG